MYNTDINQGPELVQEIVNNENKMIFKMSRVVPTNAYLVCQNILTGKVFAKNKGFRINLPWVKSKLVSKAVTNIDYSKEKYKTSEGFDIIVDTAVSVKVINPLKYVFEGENPLQELHIRTKDFLRKFIGTQDFEQLVSKNIDLKDPSVKTFVDIFDSFTQEYGLKVVDIFFENIEQTDTLKESREKDELTKRENERNLKKAENEEKIAAIKANIARIEGTANNEISADKKQRDMDVLTKAINNMSKEQLSQLKGVLPSIVGENNSVISVLGGNEAGVSAGVGMGVGQNAVNNLNANKNANPTPVVNGNNNQNRGKSKKVTVKVKRN